MGIISGSVADTTNYREGVSMKTETLDMTKIKCGVMKLDRVNCQKIKRLSEHDWNTLAEYERACQEMCRKCEVQS